MRDWSPACHQEKEREDKKDENRKQVGEGRQMKIERKLGEDR